MFWTHSRSMQRMNRYDDDFDEFYKYHADPRRRLGGFSVPDGRTTLLGGSLSELARRTDANLYRLREVLVARDPCYEYGMEHWHPKQRGSLDFEPDHALTQSLPNWESNVTMFAPRADLDMRVSRPKKTDDTEDASNNGVPVPICYLCSTLEEHQRHMAKRGLQMKAKKKPRPRVEFVAPLPVVRKKKEEPEEEQERLYRVTVRTGSAPDAATSSNVFVKIRGSHGTLRRRQLTKKRSVQFTFGRGTQEVFHIKGPTLGDLQYLVVDIDGLEKRHSWLLDEIEVKDMSSEDVWIFPCGEWLSLYAGDGIVKRRLRAHLKELEQVEYEVRVDTGTKPHSGTTANVFLTIFGKDGSSPKLRLRYKNEEEGFRKGKKDTFHHTVDDVGPIVRCRIEHDDSGDSPDWFLEKVAIEDLDDPNRCYIFPCGQWLSSERGDGATRRELHPVTRRMAMTHAKKMRDKSFSQSLSKRGVILAYDESLESEKTRYQVTVITGDRKYAGTDANVFLEMIGKDGRSGEVELDDEKNNFERAMTDVFKIEAAEVGNIKKIRIRHDNKGLGAGWFLDTIKIRKLFSKSEILQRLSQAESERDEDLTGRRGRDGRRRSSAGKDSDDDKRNRRRKKKWHSSSSEDEYDGYGRKIRRFRRRGKSSGKRQENSDSEDKRKKRGRSGDRSFSDDSREAHARRMKRKGKRLITYNGIEEWVTDSEEDRRGSPKRRDRRKGSRSSLRKSSKYDSDEDDGKRRRGKKRHDSSDDSDDRKTSRRKSGKRRDDSSDDEDEYKRHRRKSKVRFRDEFHSDEDKRKRKGGKRRGSRRSSDSDSDTSDSDDHGRRDKKRKGHGRRRAKRRDSSSSDSGSESEESLSNVRTYTHWSKERVPYCDEYVFTCQRWLAKDEDDGKIERELRPEAVTTFYRVPPPEKDKDKKERRR